MYLSITVRTQASVYRTIGPMVVTKIYVTTLIVMLISRCSPATSHLSVPNKKILIFM